VQGSAVVPERAAAAVARLLAPAATAWLPCAAQSCYPARVAPGQRSPGAGETASPFGGREGPLMLHHAKHLSGKCFPATTHCAVPGV